MSEILEVTDTPQTAIAKLCEGNPGALSVLCELFKQAPTVDPQAAFGGFTPLMALDTLGLRGSRIWMLYKDVCRQSVPLTLAVLRANQLGLLSREMLLSAVEGEDSIDVDEMFQSVCMRLDLFAKEQSISAA